MSPIKRLGGYLRPYIIQMTGAALLLMWVGVCNLLGLWMIRRIIDAVFVSRDLPLLNEWTLLLLALFLISSLLQMGHSYLISHIGQEIVAHFRIRIFSHLQTLSLGFFAKRRTGELLSRLTNDVGVIQNVLTTVPIDSLKHLVTIIGGVAVLLYLNWFLCLIILAFLPLLILTSRYFGKRLRRLSTQIQDQLADTSTITEEVISGIRTVKSFVRETYEKRRFAAQVEKGVESALERARVVSVFIPVISFMTIAAASGVLWYGGREVMEGRFTPGELVAFVLYAGILIGPFGGVARLFSQVKELEGATQRIFEILDTRPEIADDPHAVPLPPIVGKVVFHDVQFHYDPDLPVLKGISCEVSPGEVVALVGPSGGGKTTLVNLLHRFYDPTSGWIEIDGYDIKRVQHQTLYQQIGLVPQETMLFGGTIRENILYGKLDATEQEMIEAARAANAHDFILSFPKGYDTLVGEKGINLSGGQRQRIAIARAILKDPRLLILDEATAFLDTESEHAIQEALDRLMSGRTTFVIAHRLSTVQKADRILVIEKGRIVETGTHEELLEKKGLYYHLYTIRLAGVEE